MMQAREAFEFSDVALNLAHIYLAQKQYIAAIKLVCFFAFGVFCFIVAALSNCSPMIVREHLEKVLRPP